MSTSNRCSPLWGVIFLFGSSLSCLLAAPGSPTRGRALWVAMRLALCSALLFLPSRKENLISKKRNTFAKRQREQDKKHKADKKRAKRELKKQLGDEAFVPGGRPSIEEQSR